MRGRLQQLAILGLGLAGLVFGTVFWVRGEVDLGVWLATQRGEVVITDVKPGGLADRAGMTEGSTVVGLNGAEPPEGGGFPTGTSTSQGEFEGFTGDVPDTPLPEAQISFLLAGTLQVGDDGLPTILDARAVRRSELAGDLRASGWDLLVAVSMLAAAIAWQRAGAPQPILVGPAALALSVPYLVLPAQLSGTAIGLAGGVVLPAAAAAALSSRASLMIGERSLRRGFASLGIALAACACVAGLFMLLGWLSVGWAEALAATSLAAAVVIPIAGAFVRPRLVVRGPVQTLLARIDLAVFGLAVGVALPIVLVAHPPAWSIALAIVAALALRRFAVLPAAWVAERAEQQRDAVADAAEAERSRLAAELHDDILQNLWLLIRRLDAGQDRTGAEAAREIGARLRGISGNLHLPILDDLGVGPALEWLVEWMGRMGVDGVRLEAQNGARLPPVVELAMFRVAQEALANALHHGRPPIVIHYEPGECRALLVITDAGRGIAATRSSERAANHHGLTTMQLRADQIGARLLVRSSPAGGTEVRLSWQGP